MIHLMTKEWSILDTPLKVNCKNLYKLINFRKQKPISVPIWEIGHKELESIDKASLRYQLADTNYPSIVAKIDNPCNKEYRLIDGRHRLLKQMENQDVSIQAYEVTYEDIIKYAEEL